MSLFNLKPVSIKIVFICVFTLLMFINVIPKFVALFVALFKGISILPSIIFILLLILGIGSAGLLAGGVSLIIYEIFINKTHKLELNLLVGLFSMVTFIAILIKLPEDYAHFFALSILPITNTLLILKFSAWLHTEQTLSKSLTLIYASIMFFCNYNNFLGYINRFSYWEGENIAALGLPVIFFTPIAIILNFIYLIYIDKKRSK
jgi:hypothetical protein